MLVFHNTLSGAKEKFIPMRDGEVRMYHCGPTVYNYVHIGNLRAYVFADILRRAFEYNGYQVTQVMNITDIGHLTSDADEGEDKMVRALKREGKPLTLQGMHEIADFYTKAFVQDLRLLNIKQPNVMPWASEHIVEDIELIKILEEKGFAYRIKDGMYFNTAKFPEYGKLGKINLEGMRAGVRVAANPEKKNPIDFTLWKFSKPGLPAFQSHFGLGFPGWHIECSAMSRKYLGQPFDVHTGGIDHIPTHHQNEIAQSEAAYGVPLANYWMHNEHLILPADGKMAKSGENFVTLRTLSEKNISPLAYRYFLLGANYRTPISFSFDALKAAQTAYFKLLNAFLCLKINTGKPAQKYMARFTEAINDDLNTPIALAILWEAVKNPALDEAEKRALLIDFDNALGLDIENQSRILKEEMESIPSEINALADKREKARATKNFTEADAIREEIQNAGFEIMDIDGQPPLIRKHIS